MDSLFTTEEGGPSYEPFQHSRLRIKRSSANPELYKQIVRRWRFTFFFFFWFAPPLSIFFRKVFSVFLQMFHSRRQRIFIAANVASNHQRIMCVYCARTIWYFIIAWNVFLVRCFRNSKSRCRPRLRKSERWTKRTGCIQCTEWNVVTQSEHEKYWLRV